VLEEANKKQDMVVGSVFVHSSFPSTMPYKKKPKTKKHRFVFLTFF